ncbi:MAG TPA: hypothetical protein VG897_13740, partial [Terriglobales bacterium]|nr:hypothetical protein [Terriglobales bacterium]
MPVLLLLLLVVALSIGIGTVAIVVRQARQRRLAPSGVTTSYPWLSATALSLRRPGTWLAIKSRNLRAVQSALCLHHAKFCSCLEGLTSDKLFILPPIGGWVLVTGSGLPEPSDDIDACFRFIMKLSRKLGQVQYFHASRILHHHAWVQAENGKVARAYAWAGRTVWNQGKRTLAEKELGLRCFSYTDPVERTIFEAMDTISSNVDKVPLLAARWSLDPARLDEK